MSVQVHRSALSNTYTMSCCVSPCSQTLSAIDRCALTSRSRTSGHTQCAELIRTRVFLFALMLTLTHRYEMHACICCTLSGEEQSERLHRRSPHNQYTVDACGAFCADEVVQVARSLLLLSDAWPRARRCASRSRSRPPSHWINAACG